MFKVFLSRRASKDYVALPIQIRPRVLTAIHTLADDPYSGKKLRGEHDGHWSLRVWPYRIIYIIEKETVTVTVVTIGHRKDVYGRLG